MKYYRAKGEYHDYFTGNTTIPGELVTQRERDTKFRYLSDRVFEPVLCSKRDTYLSFGVRKAYTDAKLTLLQRFKRSTMERLIQRSNHIERQLKRQLEITKEQEDQTNESNALRN